MLGITNSPAQVQRAAQLAAARGIANVSFKAGAHSRTSSARRMPLEPAALTLPPPPLQEMDAQQLALDTGSFDLVWSVEVAEHITGAWSRGSERPFDPMMPVAYRHHS